jgi:hypothetical protein
VSKKTGGVPSKGTKENHMVAPKAAEKTNGPIKSVGDGSNKGGHHHPGHPNANHRTSALPAMGGTLPSYHEAQNAAWEAEGKSIVVQK